MNILTLAWRNVWRNYRRSTITIAAMTLALFVELLYSGMVAGLVFGMEDDATEFELGDVQVFHEGYLVRPSLYDTLEEPEQIIDQLEQEGYRATARLFSGGLAASGEFSAGVGFMGLDPVRDATTLSLHEAIAEGSWLSSDDPSGVVIGRGLARTLDASLGSEVLILSQASDGSIANELYEVRGILMSVAAGLDRGTILMTDRAFRELMVLPEGAHKIIVRRPKSVELEDAKALVASVASSTGTDVMTWKEINPFLAQYLDSVTGVIVIVYFIVYVAVAILILNAMLMAVFERIREIGVLKAIGYSPMQVLTMMVAEGMVQAVIACALGIVMALPFMWYLQTHGINVGSIGGMQMAGLTMPPIWRGAYTVDALQIPIIMLFFIVFAAVFYPALRAARISPVEAMHHQ